MYERLLVELESLMTKNPCVSCPLVWSAEILGRYPICGYRKEFRTLSQTGTPSDRAVAHKLIAKHSLPGCSVDLANRQKLGAMGLSTRAVCGYQVDLLSLLRIHVELECSIPVEPGQQ